MIDWKEVMESDDADELKKAKLWLFRENMRLQNERRELNQAREKFLNERVKFKDEMDVLNRKATMERQKLREENAFFEKKMEILQNGFVQLEADRKRLDKERRELESKKATIYTFPEGEQEIAGLLFRNVSNPLAVRKRYKDLVKIFHPDNVCGDAELMLEINKEFQRKKNEE